MNSQSTPTTYSGPSRQSKPHTELRISHANTPDETQFSSLFVLGIAGFLGKGVKYNPLTLGKRHSCELYTDGVDNDDETQIIVYPSPSNAPSLFRSTIFVPKNNISVDTSKGNIMRLRVL